MMKNTKWMVAVILAAMLTATTVGCTDAPDATGGTASETVTDATSESVTAPDESDTTAPGTEDDSESETAANDPGTVDPADEDAPLTLAFDDDFQAQAAVTEKREFVVLTSSDRLVIRGEGSFTLQYEGENGTETVTSEDGVITLNNTAAPHGGMVLTITSASRIELSFALDFDLGHENNPHIIEAEGATTIAFTKETSVRIQTTGWYSLDDREVEVTNYVLDDEGRVFLPAGVHGLSLAKGGEVTLTLTLLEVPAGYSAENPLSVEALDEPTSLKLYAGATLYYAYTATETGMYTIAMNAEGKSVNCRFALSSDDYAVYYGRYYDGEEWLTCEGGSTASVFLGKGKTLVIAVDHTRSDGLVGNDDVAVVIGAGEATDVIDVTELGDNIEGNLTAGGQVIYRFTAAEKGVYTVNLGVGATNKASHFTTDLDGDSYAFGETKRMSLEEGQTVYIIVSADGDTAGRVSVQVNRLTDEPLPDEGWVSGTYEGNGMTLILDRDAKSVSMGAQSGLKLTYLDGKGSFTLSVGDESVEYTLNMAENGTDMLLSYTGNNEVKQITLVYQVPVDPVGINKWEGVYVATAEDGSVTKLTIYDDGSGIFGTTRYSATDQGCSYDVERNLLTWYTYTMKIAEQGINGQVTAISVTVRGVEDPILFTLTNEAVVRLPEELPLEQNDQYAGANGYQLQYQGSYQKFNDRLFDIIGYDEGTDVYTIYGYDPTAEEKYEYKVKFVGESILVYDAEGQLLDTLMTVAAAELPDLKADGTPEESSATDAYDIRYLRVPKTGWYTFTCTEDSVKVFTGASMTDAGDLSVDWSTGEKISTSGTTLKLEEGAVIGVYGGRVSATYSDTAPVAAVGSETNPYVMDSNRLDVTSLIDGKKVYYVTYTAPTSGTYEIGFNIERMHFVVNGTNYGRNFENLEWVDYDPTCVIELTAGQTVTIALNRPTTTGDDAIIGIAPQGQLDSLFGLVGEDVSFDASRQGEYKGYNNYGEEIILKINGDSVDITYRYDWDWDGVNESSDTITGLKLNFDGTTYSADLTIGGMDWSMAFSFDANAGIRLTTDGYEYMTLTTDGGEQPGGEALFSTEEQGYWTDENWDHMLLIYEDGISYACGDNEYEFGAEDLEKSLDGLYWTFTCNGEKAYFRLAQNTDDGTFHMYLVIGDETLTLTSIY